MGAIIGILATIGFVGLVFLALRGLARGTYKAVTGNDPKVNAERAREAAREACQPTVINDSPALKAAQDAAAFRRSTRQD